MDLRVDPVLAKIAPQDPPKRLPKWVPKGSQVRKGRKYKNICFLKKINVFCPPRVPQRGPKPFMNSFRYALAPRRPSKSGPRGLREGSEGEKN